MKKNVYLLFGATCLLFPLSACGPAPAPKYTVTVTSEDTSKGTVTGGGSYTYGAQVTINATPNIGYEFNGWYENDIKIYDLPSYTFSMPKNNVNYLAKFSQQMFTVAVTSDDVTKGAVTGGGSYAYGSQVTVTAAPVINETITNYFDGWYDENDELVSKEKEYVIDNITQNITLEGRFKSYSPNADFTFADLGSNNVAVNKYNGTNIKPLIPNQVLINNVLKNVITIGKNAFLRSQVNIVVIPNGVTLIDEYAFNSCSKLFSIHIPDTVTKIGDGAFLTCSSLDTIEIPSSVTSIGRNAFDSCKVASIFIPSSVTSIGSAAFSGCSSLTSIEVDNDNPNYDSRNNCNAVIETATNKLIAGCINTIIPDNVTSIGIQAFSGSKLVNITIPNSVTSIGDSAFYNCESLGSITIPGSVTSIGSCAFSVCKSLNSIVLNDGLGEIESSAFKECSSLESITIPNSVATIGGHAFLGCGKLAYLDLSNLDHVIACGSDVFDGCDVLKIKVPSRLLDDYKSASGWQKYADKIIVA